jgi:hypothetical protein
MASEPYLNLEMGGNAALLPLASFQMSDNAADMPLEADLSRLMFLSANERDWSRLGANARSGGWRMAQLWGNGKKQAAKLSS